MITVNRETYQPREKGETMTNTTYITTEGYEAATVNNCYTRESIAESIRFYASVFAATSSKFAASAKLDDIEMLAVERFGYDWDEIEAIEAEGFAA